MESSLVQKERTPGATRDAFSAGQRTFDVVGSVWVTGWIDASKRASLSVSFSLPVAEASMRFFHADIHDGLDRRLAGVTDKGLRDRPDMLQRATDYECSKRA
jgi:hypothetical protein